ncbi:Bacterial protein of uncharacterised function (DUF961) [Streptococcus pneumoniae]|nr:Bacterial protein of uncharacterised function (DUF961) [Streptococcus pneumoniae]
MRLANGIVLDKDTTFGELKFSALRREVRIQNEDGSVSDEIKERTYDLKSKGQGRMIQVSIPASVPLKEFDYNARVELNPPYLTGGYKSTGNSQKNIRKSFGYKGFTKFQRMSNGL